MALVPEPAAPWHQLVTALVLVGLAAVSARLVWSSFRHRLWLRTIVLVGLNLGAGSGWLIAAWNPVLTSLPPIERAHLVVALDVSDSVLRRPEDWTNARAQVNEALEGVTRSVPAASRANVTASILTFRTESAVYRTDLPISDLAGAIAALTPSDFAVGPGSDLEVGLERAGDLLEAAGGVGAVLLFTDGNQTEGDALAAAGQFAARGIAVFVYPLQGSGPELAISDADLPRQVAADTTTYLRGVVSNARSEAAQAELLITRNLGLEQASGRFGPSTAIDPVPFSLEAGGWGHFRAPVAFEGNGLQYLDLTLSDSSGTEHRRRFFTFVTAPPTILAVGDNSWIEAIAPGTAKIIPLRTSELTPDALAGADAVVLDGVRAESLPAGMIDALAEGVQRDGLGLMVMNGGAYGPADDSPTVLMSFAGTPLEPLLPLVGSLRQPEPPSRSIALIIDSSGSMAGQPLDMAKAISAHIISDLLRPVDRLTLIAFTTGADRLIDNLPMDGPGKQAALQALNGIGAGGGTDPTEALRIMAREQLVNCGLIFISDGEFGDAGWVADRPDCRATVFAIGRTSPVAPGEPIAQLADPIPVGAGFDPNNVEIPYFIGRKKSFETDGFFPRALGLELGDRSQLPVPLLSLTGWAVTYAQPDAAVIAVVPKFADPVLAYREAGAGFVGALASPLSAEWMADAAGRAAVEAWIRYVLPTPMPDRYDFQMSDVGDVVTLRIALNAQADWSVPQVDRLDVDIVRGGEVLASASLEPEAEVPATFTARLPVQRALEAQAVTLLIREAGADALGRPQRIPWLIPPSGPMGGQQSVEADTYGVNTDLLSAIARRTGGAVAPAANAPILLATPSTERRWPLWPIGLALAAAAYLAAIAAQRFWRA